MAGKLLRPAWIVRGDLRANPDILYAFGDNMARAGYGGQAGQCRGEPNAVGVPTKYTPTRGPDAYFVNDAGTWPPIRQAIDAAFDSMEAHLRNSGAVAIPADGLGTGLAELPTRVPALYAHIEARIQRLYDIVRGTPDAG